MPTILVADDNSNIQKMVSLVFEEKGIRVVAVGNGEAACRKVPEVRPDLVLADVFMPVRNGYEVCEFVKQDSQFANIPVILLVGAFDPLDEKEAQRVGANGVLKKPFVPPDPLIAMVTSLLPKSAPPEPAPVKEEIPVATIQQPPPPIRPARVPYVSSEDEEPTPEEFTFGMAPRDFEGTSGAAPVLGQPPATPAAKQVDEDDYEEPASEWKRRRNTMEYEISADESANMVEKLANGNVVPDDETLDTSVRAKAYVPFGGANVPEKIESNTPAPVNQWTDLTEPEKDEPVVEVEETSTAIEDEQTSSQAASESTNGSSNKYVITKAEDAPNYTPDAEPERHEEPEAEPASAQQAQSAPLPEPIPFRMPQEFAFAPPAEVLGSESADVAQNAQESTSYSGEDPTLETGEPEKVVPQRLYDAPDETRAEVSASEPAARKEIREQFHVDPMEKLHISPEQTALSDAVSAVVAKNAGMDSAVVDNVVAKLLEKLEPQIHEALSNGLLRPLVEEILNRERNKK